MRRPRSIPAVLLAGMVTVTALTGCTRNEPTDTTSAGAVMVKAGDDTCAVSTAVVRSGAAVFSVLNSGSRTTEFEILAEDGLTVIGELENIGPGLTRTLTVQAQPGTYSTLCRPGMTGDGVGRTVLTVTGKQVELSGDAQASSARAATLYRTYVRDQADKLLVDTKTFSESYSAGNVTEAKRLYPLARASYERIEPVAESFKDLDPQLDARAGDVAEGAAWTGWHRIEKDLWALGTDRLDPAGKKQAAEFLVTKTQALKDRVDASSFTVSADSISNGAVGLLDEIAKSKVTGEEEHYSHTDLYDFQANVDGAQVAYRGVRDLAAGKNPSLVKTLDARFATLNSTLARYGSLTEGFRSYTDLTPSDVKTLSDQVTALAEPLSRLTSTLIA